MGSPALPPKPARLPRGFVRLLLFAAGTFIAGSAFDLWLAHVQTQRGLDWALAITCFIWAITLTSFIGAMCGVVSYYMGWKRARRAWEEARMLQEHLESARREAAHSEQLGRQ